MDNQRGIFVISVFKRLLENLIYNDKYEYIDKRMSESNIGARRKRGSRDHLFVVHAIINSVVNGDDENIDIVQYDILKAFDKLDLELTSNVVIMGKGPGNLI